MPIDPEEAKQLYGGPGEFVSIRKLVKAGESQEYACLDIGKNFKTKYPIKDKDYNYRVVLVDAHKKRLLVDLSGRSLISAFVTALYPHGPDHPVSPCRVKLTRRLERTMTQSELIVERLEALDVDESLPI